jgi:hypothetical protein
MNLHGAQTASFDNGLDGSKGYASLKSMKSEQDLSEICERDLLTRINERHWLLKEIEDHKPLRRA